MSYNRRRDLIQSYVQETGADTLRADSTIRMFNINRIFREQVKKLVQFFLGSSYWQGLRSNDLETQKNFMRWFLEESSIRFRMLYGICIIFLHLVSICLKGRTFNKLSRSQKEELMDRLLISRKRLICGVPVLLSTPVFMSCILYSSFNYNINLNKSP
jgi:hypothetical protein